MAAKTLKQEAREFLGDVPEENAFKSVSGHILRNISDLADELKNISDSDYARHVNTEKNDFVNWVRDCIKDSTLVRDLQRAPNRGQAAKAVASRVNVLSKRLS